MKHRGWRAGVGQTAAVLLAAVTAAGGCAFGPPDPDQAAAPPNLPRPSTSATGGGGGEVVATEVARNLDVPWGVAFLPDRSALVTERSTARILQVGPETDGKGLKVTEVQKLKDVVPEGEGGLLGIAVSPNYAQDKTVFVYFSTAADNRIAKLQLKGELTPIVTGIPRSPVHNGGRLAFGPDGFLYATTGDGSQGEQAQDPKSLGGKILRMTPEGKPAPGNPTADSLVWSSGHRDVQGLAWDAAKRMYATEFGQDTLDEVNVIEPGKNYGWPTVEGGGTDPRFTNPLITWPVADGSCSGLAVLENLLVAGCLRGQKLFVMETTANGTLLGQPQALLEKEYGRLRTVVAAPDGSLWITTSNKDGQNEPAPGDDRIIKLVFANGAAGVT